MKGCKICGISDLDTLNFVINHQYPPQFIGFICNYKKSSRYVGAEKLNELLTLDKKKSNFVAVLVKPDHEILEKIKNLPFDYYQIYDCTPEEIKKIKERYNKMIITALTVVNESDVQKYHLFSEVTDIYLFDSKGYEKSMAFDHELIQKIKSENNQETEDLFSTINSLGFHLPFDSSHVNIFPLFGNVDIVSTFCILKSAADAGATCRPIAVILIVG